MKNDVGIVLRPTVRSTFRTPCVPDAWPLKSLKVTLVLIRSALECPKRRSIEYGMICRSRINQYFADRLPIDISSYVQGLQMLVALFSWLLKDHRPWAAVK